jgi:hypothetical protein
MSTCRVVMLGGLAAWLPACSYRAALNADETHRIDEAQWVGPSDDELPPEGIALGAAPPISDEPFEQPSLLGQPSRRSRTSRRRPKVSQAKKAAGRATRARAPPSEG